MGDKYVECYSFIRFLNTNTISQNASHNLTLRIQVACICAVILM